MQAPGAALTSGTPRYQAARAARCATPVPHRLPAALAETVEHGRRELQVGLARGRRQLPEHDLRPGLEVAVERHLHHSAAAPHKVLLELVDVDQGPRPHRV